MDNRYAKGRGEVLDDTQVSVPVRFRRVDMLTERMRAFIEDEISRRSGAAGFETFDEANDFEVDDDYNPRSPHEQSIEEELNGQTFAEFVERELKPAVNEGRSNREKEAARKRASKEGAGVEGGGEVTEGDAGGAQPG